MLWKYIWKCVQTISKGAEQAMSVEKVKEARLFFKVSSLRVWCPITLALVHVRKMHKVKQHCLPLNFQKNVFFTFGLLMIKNDDLQRR